MNAQLTHHEDQTYLCAPMLGALRCDATVATDVTIATTPARKVNATCYVCCAVCLYICRNICRYIYHVFSQGQAEVILFFCNVILTALIHESISMTFDTTHGIVSNIMSM